MKKIVAILLVAAIVAGSAVMNSCGEKSEKIPEGYVAETDGGLMFGEPEFSNIYNYCPSVMVDGDDGYVWYCSNESSGSAGDHIAYRRGKNIGGKWYWGEKQIILGPEEGKYYSGNICDPDVVKGEFLYKGETYTYLMAVLGCVTVDNSANMFGFKAAKSPDGPWIDIPELSPLYDFYDFYPGYEYDGVNNFIWGWGQASLVNVDKKGKALLFYTGRSGTGQKVEYWDFSDLANPKGIYEAEVTNKGVTDLNGGKDSICNAQFMYDEQSDRFYMICDTHPFSPFEWPTNLPYSSRIYYMDNATNAETGYVFQNKKNSWTELTTIDEEKTGFPRNHNCCFYRDPYGRKLNGNKLDVAYTMSLTGADWKVLYTYRIYRLEIDLEKGKE